MWTSLLFTAIVVSSAHEMAGAAESSCFPNPSAEEINNLFRLFMIVPQIIPAAPERFYTKIFNYYVANLGVRIPPEDTRALPFSTWPNTNPDALCLIVGFDADNPEFFRNGGSLHMFELIVNIPGANIAGGNVVRLDPISPAPDTGDHRIVYLIYEQPEYMDVTSEALTSISTNFDKFNITELVSHYGLGDPIAGTFFLTQQSSRNSDSQEERDPNGKLRCNSCCNTDTCAIEQKCRVKTTARYT